MEATTYLTFEERDAYDAGGRHVAGVRRTFGVAASVRAVRRFVATGFVRDVEVPVNTPETRRAYAAGMIDGALRVLQRGR